MNEKFFITKLSLVNFRNYQSISIAPIEGVNVFSGLNGVGKTSLLDAINYISFGKSAFAGSDKETLNDQSEFFRIAGNISDGQDNVQLVVKYKNARKQLEIDDVLIKKLIDHIGRFPCVCISPKDILMIIMGSAARRQLVDKTISQQNKQYLYQLTQYRRLLKQRNETLKGFLKTKTYNGDLIQTFDQQMIPLGNQLFQTRKSFCTILNDLFVEMYKMISDDKEQTSITYVSQLHDASFEDLLSQNRDKDRYTGKSNTGIHRDDLRLEINGNNLRTFGSQGQQKSYVMALKLAQYEWLREHSKKTPLLLLDDIFDKLDSDRVKQILKMVSEKWNAQVFITDTDYERVPNLLSQNGTIFKNFKLETGKLLVEE